MVMGFACSISALKKAVFRSREKPTLYPSALTNFAGSCKELTIGRCRNPRFFQSKLMRKKLAEVMDIDIDLVSVKATTTEKLGYVGSEDGVNAHAVCLINS